MVVAATQGFDRKPGIRIVWSRESDGAVSIPWLWDGTNPQRYAAGFAIHAWGAE